jgi:release factor glutamine methyltransferase
MTTIQEALTDARTRLSAAENNTASLDAAVLLGHVLGLSRAALYTHPERELTSEELARFEALLERRARGEPVAYLTGHKEFMGLDLLVDRRALIPRPETELLVEMAAQEVQRRLQHGQNAPALRVADIGTGSGAIALALAVYVPQLPLIYATDLSAEALELAQENARRLGVEGRVRFLQGDLLEPLPEPVDLLLANLPYIASDEPLAPTVRDYEPHLALFGEDGGLGHLRRLLSSVTPHLKPGATLLLEFGYDQRARLEALIPRLLPGATWRFISDYAGWDRLVVITCL